MSGERLSAESAQLDSYFEYGAVVDRTSKGLGHLLAETSRDLARIQSIVDRSEDLYGFPAEVKVRAISVTKWLPLDVALPPGPQS